MSNSDLDEHKKDENWQHNDSFTWPSPSTSQSLRTSIFQFGTIGDLISNAGKLFGQRIIYYVLFSIVGLPLLFFGPEELGGDQAYLAFHEIVKLVCYSISVFFAVKVFDGSEVVGLRLKLTRRSFHDFLAGLAIVYIVFFSFFILSEQAGWLVIQGVVWQHMTLAGILGNILITFIIFCFVGWSEELLSRGFHLRIISKGLNLPLGIILSSAYFSIMHRDNPGGVSFDYLLFVFIAGLMLSFAFLRTGQLWLAIGLHAGWDFFGTVIFSAGSIAGLKIFSIMDIRYANFPMRFIIIEIFMLSVITLLVYFYTINRKPEPLDW
ncbi:MAG: type II CAAX endopeptidase family protein [Anaerolineales bacterium]